MTERRAQIYAVPKRFIVAWVISFVCMLGLTGGSMLYATYVDSRSNQQWCALITALDERYKRLPADASQEARDFAVNVASLRRNLDCK